MKKIFLSIILISSALYASVNVELSQFIIEIGQNASRSANHFTPELAPVITKEASDAAAKIKSGDKAGSIQSLDLLASSIEHIALAPQYDAVIEIPVSAINGIIVILGGDTATIDKHRKFPTGRTITPKKYSTSSDGVIQGERTDFQKEWAAFIAQHPELGI